MTVSRKAYDAVFLLPGLLIYVVFVFVPLALSMMFSFTNSNGINPEFSWVGFRNFLMLFRDTSFRNSLAITVAITAITTFLTNSLGIAAAVAVERPGQVFRWSRTLVFIPAILSPVVVSFVWAYMTQTNGGIINTMLGWLSINPIDLYASVNIVVMMVSWVISWAALGFYTTVYIASLKSIPREVYEAASIDGAKPVQRFFAITLPLMRPAIVINTITAVIWGLKQYDFVKVMVPGYIQTITVYAIERAFEYNMFGYSSAIILVLLILTLLVSAMQMAFMNRKEISY